MDQDIVPTQEEIAAEQADLHIPKEEDIRAKFVTEYGFDETVDAEKLDKLVKKDMEDRKRLSKTIAQKIALRDASKKKPADVTPPADDKTPKTPEGLSFKDGLVLINAGITNEEDIDEVVEYAKYKKISIADALKSAVVKSSLSEKAEIRKTQNAQNTQTTRRGNQKPSDAELLTKANANEEVDANDLAQARFNKRKEKISKR